MPTFKNPEKQKQINEMDLNWKCDNCGSEEVYEDTQHGDMVCSNCGKVLGDRIINLEEETRHFENDSESQQKGRVGGPQNVLLEGISELSTQIQRVDGGRKLAKIQQDIVMSNAEKTLRSGFQKVESVCAKMALPQKHIYKAQEIFKKMQEVKPTKIEKKIDLLVAACVYAACRLDNVGRGLNEIEAITSLRKKDIGQCYMDLQNTLKLQMEAISASDFIRRFCSTLQLPLKLENYCIKILDKAKVDPKNITFHKTPMTLAASVLWLVVSSAKLKGQVSLADVCNVTGMAESTIKVGFKDLADVAGMKELLVELENMTFSSSTTTIPSSLTPSVGNSQTISIVKMKNEK